MHTHKDGQTIAIVGLGYVGLPLAVEFGKKYETVGFDIDASRVNELKRGFDRTNETEAEAFSLATRLTITAEVQAIASCNIYIVTVPTPVDDANRPDLSPLESASSMIGRCLKPGDMVIYESTVYPGTTEEVCVPILERISGLKFNRDFFCGYSPERINPGDKVRSLTKIKKVVSGSTTEIAEKVDVLYSSIISAGTHRAPTIRVAEAAKVIENTQRDVNIALINELAMIFDAMGVDTHDVLDAASTKWNFLRFTPGLVGGHCIGVDPYYLTHKATVLGYHPELILTARRINSRMGIYVAHQVIRMMASKRRNVVDARILMLGLTFKEDCPDLRNTRAFDVYEELVEANAIVEIHDPWVDVAECEREFGITPVAAPDFGSYDAIVLAVAHSQFKDTGFIDTLSSSGALIYDAKGVLPRDAVDGRL